MKNSILISLCLILLAPAHPLQAQDRDISYMVSGGKLNPLQAIMDIRHYTIALDVDIQHQQINGYTTIDLLLSRSTDTLLFDFVHLLTVTKITVNNTTSPFYQKGDYIFITNAHGFQPGKQSVKIEYGGNPPVAVNPPWAGGFSWKTDTNGNPWVAINCQSEGGKVYFPCKDHPGDEPNEGADLIITVPKGLVVAGPGLLQETTNIKNDKTTYHWKTNYTISNYCLVFNIGKYKVVNRTYTSIDGHTVPMQFYVLEEDTAYAMQALLLKERDTRILEKYFGEYPWMKEKIGLAEVPNPCMEHQTMITYGDKFRYKTIAGQKYSDNLYHEYAHEWWANKVTNKDWAHMWIQEGIATYAEALAMREMGGENMYDSMILNFKMGIQNKKPIVQGEEVNSGDTYTGDIYIKGAFFMHTLRYVTGDSVFFPTLKELATAEKYTYNNFVTTDDVQQLFSARSGRDLRPLFDLYLRTTGKLDFVISQTGYNLYSVQVKNISMPLPVDIITSTGTQQKILTGVPVWIRSSTPPVVDPKGYYLKRVMME
ncbi:MAG: M1 family metallopeptidase [Chitinophagaceae bacterium]|nr:M1 family metallopeptidase [Chitinophagaceae bacterium]